MRMIQKIIFSLLIILSTHSFAYAEDMNKIAAIVGGDIISTLDVRNRALMIVNSANNAAPNTPTSEGTITATMPQALQMLIDEKLYNQEAERLRISVSPAELNHAIAGIEAKNHLQAGGFDHFLETRNIPADTVKEQIRSQIILVKIINARVRPKITVSEGELGIEINRLGGNNPSLSLKQIFVSLADTDKTKQDALKLQLEHIQSKAKGCDNFDIIANAENAVLSPTLLTVNAASLNPAIREVVNSLKIGEPSPVLKTADSLQLLMLCQKGQATISSAEKQQLSEAIMQRKIDLQTKQYVRNLRQETYTEIRM